MSRTSGSTRWFLVLKVLRGSGSFRGVEEIPLQARTGVAAKAEVQAMQRNGALEAYRWYDAYLKREEPIDFPCPSRQDSETLG